MIEHHDSSMGDTPDTVASIRALAHAYEQALIDGDGDAAAAFFAEGDDVTRFGPDGAQYGSGQVRGFRKSYASVEPPQWLYDEVVELAPTVAVHKAVMARGETVLQRTQNWVFDVAWKVVHAHVSRLPGSDTMTGTTP